METTVFNPVQQHLLKMFAYDGSEERLLEVKKVLTQYCSQKLEKRLDDLWDAGILDQNRLDELRTMHLRTDFFCCVEEILKMMIVKLWQR